MGIAETDLGQLRYGQFKTEFNPGTGAFTAWNVLLKEYWLPGVIDIINSKRVATRLIRRDTTSVMGKYIYQGLNTGRNVGVMSSSPRAKLVAPGRQKNRKAKYYTKNDYGRILFDGQSASSSRGRMGSNIRLMNLEVTGLARDIQVDQNRQLFGTGSGRLARISGAVALSGGNTVIPVADPNGITAQGPGTQFLDEDMRLCFLDDSFVGPAGTGEGTPVFMAADGFWLQDSGGLKVTEVVSVDPSASTITVSGDWTGSLVANTYIYKANEYGSMISTLHDSDTNRGKEINGFAAICSETDPPLQRPAIAPFTGDPESGGLGDLSVNPLAANYEPRWTAFAAHSGGIPQPFQEGMFQTMISGVDQLGDGLLEVFLTTHGIRDQYAFQLMQQKRFVNTRELPGGFKALTYNDIPVIPDKDCSRGRIYGLDLGSMTLCYENDYHWREDGGSTLMALDDYDAWQATLLRYHEVACRYRNGNAVHRDIQDS